MCQFYNKMRELLQIAIFIAKYVGTHRKIFGAKHWVLRKLMTIGIQFYLRGYRKRFLGFFKHFSAKLIFR